MHVVRNVPKCPTLSKFTTRKKKIPQDIFHFYHALSARKTGRDKPV